MHINGLEFLKTILLKRLITSQLVRTESSRRGMHSQISLNLTRELSQILEKNVKKYIRDKYYRNSGKR